MIILQMLRYGKLIHRSINLTHRNISPLFIYLKDHNKDITPEDSRLNLSYAKPSNLFADAPKHKQISFKLDHELEQLLQRQIFEQYKNKVLQGVVDEVQQKEPDPLWGEDPVPVHYFHRLSKTNLMGVSHPQRLDIQNSLNQIYSGFFTTQFQGQITKELVKATSIEMIAELSLKARADDCSGQIWFAIEQQLSRGHKLHLLTPLQLIKLKYAFQGHQKQGTPIFHQILASLLKEDIPKMDVNQLVHLFYACRYSNPGFTNLQPQILQALKPLYSQLTFRQKVDFLLLFALSTKPIKFHKKVHKRRVFEFRELASSVLFRLNFWDLQLNDDRVGKLIFSLAKLRIPNTKFITYPILQYIKEHFQTFTANKDALFQAAVYLPELQNGEGVGDQQFMKKLKEVAVARWEQFTKIQQIRLVHSFWNYRLMDQGLLALYKAIQFEADSTFLYYASQIEHNVSSERQWQIIQLSVMLQFIPLPYFVAFKRFYNYIKSTTQWNLTPLHDKLLNTEYYYDVMRLYDTISQVKPYKGLRQFQKFAGVKFASNGCPIENLQLAHFAYPIHQVSLDIISKKQYIPGTTQLKQTYLNKVRSLKNIGWKHLAFDENQIKDLPLLDFIKNIQECYHPYVEQQKAIIEQAEFKRAQQVQVHKIQRDMCQFQVRDLNYMKNLMEGKADDEQVEIDPITGEVIDRQKQYEQFERKQKERAKSKK